MKLRSLFIVALSFSALVGCGGSYKAPTNAYDKVKTAFNGVEKSFKKITPAKKSINSNGLAPRKKNVSDGLNTIFSVYSNSDIRGNTLDDLSYTEPPMIQFRYLKSVFDKVGNGYEFGTKYYDIITGETYVDFETGLKDETKKAANKYAYSFKLGIDINIDESDLINADVSFDITLSNDNNNYRTKWYVNLLLDYDMEVASPNYTLTMYTTNDEKELPYYDRFTYEYDYVNVKDNAINEWRKFCMHSSEELIKDANHQAFSDYVNGDDFEYVVDHPKWFKDGKYYRTVNMSDGTKLTVGNAMYDGLGLNSTDINPNLFINKEGKQNSVIQEMYQSFSRTYGDDIIYDLVTRDEVDNPGIDPQSIKGLRMVTKDTIQTVENRSIPNVRLADMFENGYNDPDEGKTIKLSIWYADADNQLISELDYNDIVSLAFSFGMYDTRNENNIVGPIAFDASSDFLTAYASIKEHADFYEFNRHCRVYFKHTGFDVEGYTDFYYAGELPEEGEPQEFPEELKTFGVPEYTSSNPYIEFEVFDRGENHYFLTIDHTDGQDTEIYTTQTLPKAGFIYENNAFRKQIDSNNDLVIVFNADKGSFVTLEAWLEPRQSGGSSSNHNSSSSEDLLLINSLVIVGSFNDWDIQTSMALVGYENNFTLRDVHFLKDAEFKFVGNMDWTVCNQGSPYGGFGYDDIVLEDKTGTYLSRGEGKDGNIHVNMECSFSIEAKVENNRLQIYFSKFNLSE